MRRLPLLLAPALLCAAAVPAYATPVPGAPGCPVFPADNVWHADVSRLPVHARSADWLANAGAGTRSLHPDFGASGDPAVPYGIPYHVVPSTHSKVNVAFDYDDESDPGPYPLGSDTPIEGGAGSGGDMHTVTVDKDTCTLYETWYTQHTASGWTAGSGAIWSLRSNAQRPAGWTSADAAGLPILPGLLRLDEVQAGSVDHAIRFTVAKTDQSYLWPARHYASTVKDANRPPMGARFRLKASFDVSSYRADTQVVLRAMKKHGMLLADNGSDWYFQGAASNDWPDGFVSDLKRVPASAFEAVDESSLMVSPDSMAVRTTTARPRPTRGMPGTTYKPFTPEATPPPRRTTPAPRGTATATAPPAPRPSGPATPATGATATTTTTAGPAVAEPPAQPPPTVRRTWPWLAVPAAVLALVAALAARLRRA
ncbi:MAG TPA: hypothetical protein VF519_06425 [Mycobacteriales bacterium]